MNNKLKVNQLQTLDVILKRFAFITKSDNIPKLIIKINDHFCYGDFFRYSNTLSPCLKEIGNYERIEKHTEEEFEYMAAFLSKFHSRPIGLPGVLKNFLSNPDLLLNTLLSKDSLKSLPVLPFAKDAVPCIYGVRYLNSPQFLDFLMLSETDLYEVVSIIFEKEHC